MWSPILIWSLKVGLLLSLLYGLYFMLFRNNTQFHLKRVLLLSVLAAALLWPVIKFSASERPASTTQVFQKLDESLISPVTEAKTKIAQVGEAQKTENSTTMSTSDIIWWVYLTGVAISFLVFFSELAKLTYWRLTGTEMRDLGKNVISHPSVKYPFSFWKWIFIPELVDYSESEWAVIQEHENLHLKQKHTVDILCAALAQCALWYHPAIYLFQKGMKTNHEALADSAVLKSTNFGRYTEILLALSLRTSSVTLGHSFALISSLSKRLKVMKLKKTSKRSSYASIISFAVLALVIASQTVSYGQEKGEKKETESMSISITSEAGIITFSSAEIFKRTGKSPGYWVRNGRLMSMIPYILTPRYKELIERIKQTYYSDDKDQKTTFRLELSDSQKSYYDELTRPLGFDQMKTEFIAELSVEDRIELYELSKKWAEENIKSIYPDYKIISEMDFIEQKYLIIKSYTRREVDSKYKRTDIFTSKQVDEIAEPVGGIDRFLNNVALNTKKEQGLSIEDMPKTIEFEFLVNSQGHVTQVDLLSKVKGDEETQDKIYHLLRQLNDNIQSVSRVYGWKPALKDNEFVSSKYKIEIPKSLL